MELEERPVRAPVEHAARTWRALGLVRPAVLWGMSAATGLTLIVVGRAASAQSLQALGTMFGLLVGLTATALVLSLTAELPFHPATRTVVSSLPILGVAVAAFGQVADVLAVQLRPPVEASRYLAASSLARVAVLLVLPAVAWALTATGPVRRRRLVAAAALAGLFLTVFEVAPGAVLEAAFGAGRTPAGALRLLGPAMLASTGALLLAGTLAASRRLPWAWSSMAIAVAGLAVLFGVARAGDGLPTATLVLQVTLAGMLAAHALRLRQTARPGGVVILNWRDTRNPEGGGSEVFAEEVAAGLAASGRRVTMFCAAYPGGVRQETVRGVRILRRGSATTVYLWAFLYHLTGRFGPHDVVVDVQNGVPFLSTLYCHRPQLVLVHHVHREQWKIVFTPRMARFGWWVESRVAPRIYRHARYAAVSEATRSELAQLGVRPDAIDVVRNGTVVPASPEAEKTPFPSICVLGRLVPHKRVEYAITAAARSGDRNRGLKVYIMGRGYWEPELRALADALGLAGAVEFMGWVDEQTKARVLSSSWVLAMPSVKEGWGLAVMEAASRGTPAVGLRGAGGLSESIVDGVTGLLADDEEGFAAAVETLLSDVELRERMARAGRERATTFGWERTTAAFARALDGVVAEDEVSRRELAWGRARA